MSNASSPRSSSGIRSRASSLASWALSHEEAHGLSGLPLASSSEGEARRTEEEEELLPGDFGSDLGSGSSAGDDDDDGIPWSEDEIGSPRLVTRGVQTEDSFADLDRGSSTDGDVTFGSRGVWMRESSQFSRPLTPRAAWADASDSESDDAAGRDAAEHEEESHMRIAEQLAESDELLTHLAELRSMATDERRWNQLYLMLRSVSARLDTTRNLAALLEMVTMIDSLFFELHSESSDVDMSYERLSALPDVCRGIPVELVEQATQSFTLTAPPPDFPQCSICLEEFAAQQEVRSLPCGHLYHKPCVDRWFGVDPRCPICKADIRGP
eukprot:RCo023238